MLDPDINLCITAALNVSPAPNVSTRPPGGGKEEEVNNYKIIINFDLIKYQTITWPVLSTAAAPFSPQAHTIIELKYININVILEFPWHLTWDYFSF